MAIDGSPQGNNLRTNDECPVIRAVREALDACDADNILDIEARLSRIKKAITVHAKGDAIQFRPTLQQLRRI
jgi:hypothetical protein